MRSPVVLVRSSTCPVKNEYGQVRGELQRIISARVMIKTFFGHSFSACFTFQVLGLILFGIVRFGKIIFGIIIFGKIIVGKIIVGIIIFGEGCPVRGTEGNTQVSGISAW